MISAIEHYRPQIPPVQWAGIRKFVVKAALETGAPNEKWATDLLGFLARFVLWATQTAGLPLDRDIIFLPSTIDRYVLTGMTLGPRSRQLAETRLRNVAQALMSPLGVRRFNVPTNDARPYLAADLPALFSWAATQRSPRTRQDAHAVLGFAGGAGLRGTELAQVRGRDVIRTDDGHTVAIRGDFPRVVAVRQGWNRAVERAMLGVDDDSFVAIPHGAPANRAAMLANFGRRAGGHAPRVARLRVTWVMTFLNVLPLGSLLKAAGYKTPASLKRYTDLAATMDEADLLELLRRPGGDS